MNRLFATMAVLGLLAAPAWAQTMNSAPAGGDSMAKPPMDAPAAAPAPAKHAAKHMATTQGSGSSVRHIARSRHARSDHAGDHSADKLNRQELQQLPQSS